MRDRTAARAGRQCNWMTYECRLGLRMCLATSDGRVWRHNMAEMNGLMLLQRREGWTRDNSCEAVRETCTNVVGENMSLHIATARHKDVGTRHTAAADALYRPPRGSAILTVSRSASDSESHAHRPDACSRYISTVARYLPCAIWVIWTLARSTTEATCCVKR